MRVRFEKIRANLDSSFAVREKKTRRFKGTYHFHPEIELTQIVAGTGDRLIGDEISPFQPCDLVLIGSNLPHRYVSDAACKTMLHARVIQFSSHFLGESFLRSTELAGTRRLLAKASRGLSFSSSVVTQADRLISQLFETKGLPKLIRLLELLDLLGSCQKPRPIASAGYVCTADTADAGKINKALNYVQENMHEPITLDEVSRLLDVSPATCNRLFRKTLGKTFKDFLIDARISHACKLLLETSDSVLHIAESSGFQNLSNFNRLFKTRKEESPSAYRKRAKANTQAHQ